MKILVELRKNRVEFMADAEVNRESLDYAIKAGKEAAIRGRDKALLDLQTVTGNQLSGACEMHSAVDAYFRQLAYFAQIESELTLLETALEQATSDDGQI